MWLREWSLWEWNLLHLPGETFIFLSVDLPKPIGGQRRFSIGGWEALSYSKTYWQAILWVPINENQDFCSNKRKRFSHNCCYEFPPLQRRKRHLRDVCTLRHIFKKERESWYWFLKSFNYYTYMGFSLTSIQY